MVKEPLKKETGACNRPERQKVILKREISLIRKQRFLSLMKEFGFSSSSVLDTRQTVTILFALTVSRGKQQPKNPFAFVHPVTFDKRNQVGGESHKSSQRACVNIGPHSAGYMGLAIL